ncbi:MAG: TrmH family RNA methyltransferase [Anaeroplasmataceae bacterium]
MITSLNNATIKELVKLNTSKGRKEKGLFIVEGQHLVKEAKDLGIVVDIYTIDEKLEGNLVSIPVMNKICNTNTTVNQIAVCRMLNNKTLSNKVLILDGIQDPGNMGALMRSAKAFNFNTIFLCDGCVDIYNDKVIRASQGAIFKLNYLYGDKIEFIKSLSDYDIYGTNVVNGIDVKDVIKTDKLALILGNEGNGISKEINALNLKNLYIKMDNTESLNVSVAGGILMYELK